MNKRQEYVYSEVADLITDERIDGFFADASAGDHLRDTTVPAFCLYVDTQGKLKLRLPRPLNSRLGTWRGVRAYDTAEKMRAEIVELLARCDEARAEQTKKWDEEERIEAAFEAARMKPVEEAIEEVARSLRLLAIAILEAADAARGDA